MKILTQSLIFLFTSVAIKLYANDLEISHKYHSALEALNIEQNQSKAQLLLEEILELIPTDHDLFEEVTNTYLSINNKSSQVEIKKAIAYLTGRKEEVFCKDVGLVHAKLFHNDQTKSELFFAQGERTLVPGSYSVVTNGKWQYVTDSGYRTSVTSDVWINSADQNHYDIQELRLDSDNNGDGRFKASWQNGTATSRSFNSRGHIKEPAPMFLAIDFAAWGTPDLGYRISFVKGDRQTLKRVENTIAMGRINLSSERVVKERFDSYETKDFSNNIQTYSDCFLVNTVIKFSGYLK